MNEHHTNDPVLILDFLKYKIKTVTLSYGKNSELQKRHYSGSRMKFKSLDEILSSSHREEITIEI